MRLLSKPHFEPDEGAMLLTAERARTLLESVSGPAGFPPKRSRYHHARDTQWRAAIVVGVSCLAVLGDESDASLMADAVALLRLYESDYSQLVGDARSALAAYVKRFPATSSIVSLFAAHASASVRRALAAGLTAHLKTPEGLHALLALVRDPDPTVRHAAREAAPKDSVLSWHGLFSSDPFEPAVAWARETAPQAAAKAEEHARAVIEETCTFYAKPSWEPAAEAKLVAKWDIFPDALVVDLVRNVATYDIGAKASPAITAAAAREAGPELVIALACRWAEAHGRFLAQELSKVLARPSLADARRAVGDLAAHESCSSRVSRKQRTVLSELVIALRGDDMEAIAEWFLVAEPKLDSSALYAMSAAVEKAKSLPRALVAWSKTQFEAGDAFRSQGRRYVVEKVLAASPAEVRRELARAYVGDDPNRAVSRYEDEADDEAQDDDTDDPRRRWALRELLSRAYDLAVSGPLGPLAESLYAIDANRTCFLTSEILSSFVLSAARAELRAQTLTFPQARTVACAVRSFAEDTAPDDERERAERARIVEALADPSDALDLSDVELSSYHAIRRGHRFEGAGLALADFEVVGYESEEGAALLGALTQGAAVDEEIATKRLIGELYTRPSQALIDAVAAIMPEDIGERDGDSGLGSLVYGLDFATEKVHRKRFGSTDRNAKLIPGTAPRPNEALVGSTEARSMLTRARDAVDERAMTTSPIAHSHQSAVLALVASASVFHGDTSNLRTLADAAENEMLDRDYRETVLGGIGDLVALSAAKDSAVRRLAKSSDRWVRRTLAQRLRADEPAGRALLLAMVSDTSSHVRDSARKSLGEGAVPWWTGIFSRDPGETLSDDDAAALAPTFAAIAAALGPPPEGRRRVAIADEEAKRLSRALPTALALDLARQQGRDEGQVRELSPWVLAAVRREGGEAMLADILAHQAHGDVFTFAGVEIAAKTLAPAARLRFALLALRLRAYDSDADTSTITKLAVSLLKPADREVAAAELLAMYRNDEEAFEDICGSFTAYFAGREAPAALLDWAFGLLEKEEDEARRLTHIFAKSLLERAPKERARALALRLLEHGSANRREWALLALLGRLHDASLDGPKAARVRALYSEPSLRGMFLNQHKLLDQAITYARADLRDNRLEYEEARSVVFAILRQREKQRSTTDVPPHDLPPRERAAYLALREKFRFQGKSWHLRDFDIIGYTTDLAKAHLAAALAAVRAGDEDAATAVGLQLLSTPNETFLEVGMDMARVYAETGLPLLLQMGLEHAHEKLGLELEAPFRRRQDDML